MQREILPSSLTDNMHVHNYIYYLYCFPQLSRANDKSRILRMQYLSRYLNIEGINSHIHEHLTQVFSKKHQIKSKPFNQTHLMAYSVFSREYRFTPELITRQLSEHKKGRRFFSPTPHRLKAGDLLLRLVAGSIGHSDNQHHMTQRYRPVSVAAHLLYPLSPVENASSVRQAIPRTTFCQDRPPTSSILARRTIQPDRCQP